MGATPKVRKAAQQSQDTIAGIPIPASVMYFLKRPLFHVAMVIVFLFSTTVLVDPLAGAVRTQHVPEKAVSLLDALRDLVVPANIKSYFSHSA